MIFQSCRDVPFLSNEDEMSCWQPFCSRTQNRAPGEICDQESGTLPETCYSWTSYLIIEEISTISNTLGAPCMSVDTDQQSSVIIT